MVEVIAALKVSAFSENSVESEAESEGVTGPSTGSNSSPFSLSLLANPFSLTKADSKTSTSGFQVTITCVFPSSQKLITSEKHLSAVL